jgi:hypothetical protein
MQGPKCKGMQEVYSREISSQQPLYRRHLARVTKSSPTIVPRSRADSAYLCSKRCTRVKPVAYLQVAFNQLRCLILHNPVQIALHIIDMASIFIFNYIVTLNGCTKLVFLFQSLVENKILWAFLSACHPTVIVNTDELKIHGAIELCLS